MCIPLQYYYMAHNETKTADLKLILFVFWTVVNLTLIDLPGLTKVAVGMICI